MEAIEKIRRMREEFKMKTEPKDPVPEPRGYDRRPSPRRLDGRERQLRDDRGGRYDNRERYGGGDHHDRNRGTRPPYRSNYRGDERGGYHDEPFFDDPPIKHELPLEIARPIPSRPYEHDRPQRAQPFDALPPSIHSSHHDPQHDHPFHPTHKDFPSKQKKQQSNKNFAGKNQAGAEPVIANDYCQHFVDTKQRPQNFIRDHDVADRFTEYPKLQELINLKSQQIRERATPPMYLQCDLLEFNLTSLGTKFDVIYIDPPWVEYQRRCPGAVLSKQDRVVWSFEQMMDLRIDLISAKESFVFLWVGSAEGLSQGRDMLQKWGFRRCEDICWVKSNREHRDDAEGYHQQEGTIFQRTTEHCLMGIKGTIKRSTDHHFIHANVDTDVIVSEAYEYGSTRKPDEMYEVIEHFCLGRRRLELFACDHNIRPGWVSLGASLTTSNWNKADYLAHFNEPNANLLGYNDAIDKLRPKTPPLNQGGQGGGEREGGGGNQRRGGSRGGSRNRRGGKRGGSRGGGGGAGGGGGGRPPSPGGGMDFSSNYGGGNYQQHPQHQHQHPYM